MTHKPTIFFSHSSRDCSSLQVLRDLFDSRTGGSVDVFMSSDGQSIPFGRNWVHEVESGLERAKLMFVFLTPNSIKSSWLYFEAGHAYSKGIRVVPVGMLGIDLALVPPPLSLIQGFNIKSESGLGNIVAIANQEFGHRHDDLFSAEDFARIASASGMNGLGGLGQYVAEVDEIACSFPEYMLASNAIIELIKDAAGRLNAESIECVRSDARLEMMGTVIVGIVDSSNSGHGRIEVKIDPVMALQGLEVLRVVKKSITKDPSDLGFMQVFLTPGITLAKGFHRWSGRLSGTGVKVAGSAECSFRSIVFSLDRKIIQRQQGYEYAAPFIRVKAQSDGSELCEDLRALLDLLFERRVLWRDG